MNTHNFKHWFNNKLTIGGYPYKVNESFDVKDYNVIINVSDEYYAHIDEGFSRFGPIKSHWFPMNEFKQDMGFNSIYGAMIILWEAEKKGLPVYLHCHAGHNRSPTVAAAYYYLRTGEHLEAPSRSGSLNKLIKNCEQGLLPPVHEMERFLIMLREELKKEMLPATLTKLKMDCIKNF